MATKTIKCKIPVTPKIDQALTATASAFACACNQALDTAKQLGTSHKIKLQHACYQAIRQETGLTANLYKTRISLSG